MSDFEFSRMVDLRSITDAPLEVSAQEAECEALAQRFGLVAIRQLGARVALSVDGEIVRARGTLSADIVQSCAVSGDDLPMQIKEQLSLTFIPASSLPAHEPDEEIDLEADELDDIPYDGTAFDLGEAVAQSLALAIDPYATGPDADAARREHGLIEEGASGPLAEALKGLNLN